MEPKKGECVCEQLVPQRCRDAVLHLAHEVPMAGHLGTKTGSCSDTTGLVYSKTLRSTVALVKSANGAHPGNR